MLRMIALVSNCIWIPVVIIAFISEYRSADVSGLIVFVLVVLTLIVNIAALLCQNGKILELWPFVLFQRKALEEKIKIEKLMQERQGGK